MKSKNLGLSLFILIMTIVLSDCSSPSTPQSSDIANSIDVSYITGPQVDLPTGVNPLLSAWITNQTKYCINFPPDYGIKVFAETSDGWTEIPNRVKYISDHPVLLKPKGDIFSQHSLDAQPDLSALTLTQPTNFYVEISGHLCDDEKVIIEKKIPFVVAP